MFVRPIHAYAPEVFRYLLVPILVVWTATLVARAAMRDMN
jgi:hypothetical protein